MKRREKVKDAFIDGRVGQNSRRTVVYKHHSNIAYQYTLPRNKHHIALELHVELQEKNRQGRNFRHAKTSYKIPDKTLMVA